MGKQEKQQALLKQLYSLEIQPTEQQRYALELLEQERGSQIVAAALEVITPAELPIARPVLLRLYAYYTAAGVKRDAGGHLRIALLTALLPIAEPADTELAERTTRTYEFAPDEVTGDLRAAGLVLLSNLNSELACYHCIRLLYDQYTSRMSGQPAVSAVRLLASHKNLLPLYAYALSQIGKRESMPEVLGECLRHLAGEQNTMLVNDLFTRYMDVLFVSSGK